MNLFASLRSNNQWVLTEWGITRSDAYWPYWTCQHYEGEANFLATINKSPTSLLSSYQIIPSSRVCALFRSGLHFSVRRKKGAKATLLKWKKYSYRMCPFYIAMYWTVTLGSFLAALAFWQLIEPGCKNVCKWEGLSAKVILTKKSIHDPVSFRDHKTSSHCRRCK